MNNKDKSLLTAQEITMVRFSCDLGAGYAKTAMPEAWLKFACDDLSKIDDGTLDEKHLNASVSALLSTSESSHIKALQSGSIALHRAIVAAKNYLLETIDNQQEVIAVTTSPSIDIIGAMCRELVGDNQTKFVNFALGESVNDSKIDEIVRAVGNNPAILVITSPENPTGMIWSEQQLSDLADRLANKNAVLVVDHCFLLAGVQKHKLHAVWQSEWFSKIPCIGLWDTGKTFDFSGDKVGFIIYDKNNKQLNKSITNAISIIQYDIADRLKYLYYNVFRSPEIEKHLQTQNQKCAVNFKYLEERLTPYGLTIIRPEGGSLVLLYANSKVFSHHPSEYFSEHSIGVVDAKVFFSEPEENKVYLRIALAKEEAYFRGCIDKLTQFLEEIVVNKIHINK